MHSYEFVEFASSRTLPCPLIFHDTQVTLYALFGSL